MRVATTIPELAEALGGLTRSQPRPLVALVPTMGALHTGHRSLCRLASTVADVVVVSIFVNPLQFGPDEDYARYPRSPETDLETCQSEGVDLVFAPSVAELYPAGRQVIVAAGQLGTVLEGRSRPGHFDGVLTVQAKLLNLIDPDYLIFGQQDAQQLAVVRKMVTDLNFHADVLGAPTVREADGLAACSRNRYLLPHERTAALALSGALRVAAQHTRAGAALAAAQTVLDLAEADGTFRLDYVTLVHPQTFAEVADDHLGDALLLVAGWVGDTRLIDNAPLSLSEVELHEPERGLVEAESSS